MQANHRFPIARIVDKVFQRRDWNHNGLIDLPGATGQAEGGAKACDEVSLRLRDRLLLKTAKALGYDVPPGVDPVRLAAAADADGDRRLTRAELTRLVRGLDANRDEHVDRLELTAGLAALRRGGTITPR